MAAVYRPSRMHGQRCTFLIEDDLLALAGGLPKAKYQAATILQLLTSLGFFLSLNKCALLPSPSGKFLGLTMNVPHLRFEVPADKVEYSLELIQAAIASTTAGRVASRALARVAGVLFSLKDAIHMAPLYTLLLFRAMDPSDWDRPLDTSQGHFAVEDLLYWQKRLTTSHHKSWLKKTRVPFVWGCP